MLIICIGYKILNFLFKNANRLIILNAAFNRAFTHFKQNVYLNKVDQWK